MSKKTLGVSCIVLLGILTVAVTAYLKIDALYQDATLERHRLVCEAITHTIDDSVARARQYVSFAASVPALANAASERNRSQAQELLHELAQNSKEALTPPLSLLDTKGTVLASSVFTASQAGSALFQEAVQGRFALQGPELAKETNEATMLLAAPVAHNTKIVGVLVAHLDLHQLAIDALPILHDVGMDHSYAFALDASGRVLMHTNFGALVGISMQDEPWARAMLQQKNGRISYDLVGSPRVAVFASLPKTGWTIAVSLREEDVLAPQRAIRNWFLGCGLAIALLVLPCLYLLQRKSQFHLRAGSKLALTELASELRSPSGETPGDAAELLHLALSAALEKARQSAALLERVISGQSESLHDILRSMMEGILHVGEDGAILFANPAALRMLQCQEKDVLGKRMRDVIRSPVGLGADSDGFQAVYQAVHASLRQTFTEKILRRQDESRLLADIIVQPLSKKDGKAHSGGALLAFCDVSLVNMQRHMLSAITGAIGATYFVWDEQCRLVDCGDNCTRFLLAPSKQEVLKDITQFIPEYQVNGRTSASELERHQLYALNTGGDSCDWQFKNAMGILIPCELILRRFERCGRPAVLGFARDMRLILAATEKLARGHTNLRQVLDALPLAVGVVGKGTLLYANHEMEEFLALHGNDPALAPFSPMQSAASAANQDFQQKIDNRHLQLFKPDGTMHDYLLSCFPTEFDDTSALMGWLVDVTRLKTENQRLIRDRDQALERIESNRRFLGQLERDIREPLNGILFTLQHAVQTTSGAERHQAVNAAYTLGKHLQDTLSYMLHMSGVTPPALVHDITRFAVADFFHDALHAFADEAAAKGITFDFRPDPALPEALVGDRTLLRLTINHLVDNALKYTVTGGVSVDVTPLPSGKTDTVTLHITISDTGLGISDAQLGVLFRSFSDEGGTKPLTENTSFGLAMVRSYVRLLEGELCALSEPGQGTEMHLVLPFALHLPENALFAEAVEESLPFLHVPDAAPVRDADAAQSKGRILVVDDIPTNAHIMILILQKMGYEATGADSGAKALHLLEKEDFDLVFMDIQMPHTSGTEITARIRNDSTGRYPRNIPIVAMTAHAMLGDPEKYLRAGMDDYLSKPVIIEDVANILNNLLRQRIE